MDLQQHYRQLSNYDEWANREVIAVLRAAGRPLDRSLKLIAHIVAAEYVVEVLDRSVHYKNSKGEEYDSLVRDILTHVFMHSAYHRGQIAADMRQDGVTPAYTDFIQGVRKGLVE